MKKHNKRGSANGSKNPFERPEKMAELYPFWLLEKPKRSEDMDLGSGEWTYKIEVYEERYGREAMLSHLSSGQNYRLNN